MGHLESTSTGRDNPQSLHYWLRNTSIGTTPVFRFPADCGGGECARNGQPPWSKVIPTSACLTQTVPHLSCRILPGLPVCIRDMGTRHHHNNSQLHAMFRQRLALKQPCSQWSLFLLLPCFVSLSKRNTLPKLTPKHQTTHKTSL